MIKCREWQGWEEFLKKQITKRKWEEGKCGKAGDGRDGSAVPNGLTGSVVAGGASVHRAQCSPLIHLGKPSQTKVQIKQCPRFYCPPPMSHTSAKVDFFSEKFGEFCCRLVTPATSGMVAINRQISWHLSDIQFGKVPVDSDHYQDNFTLIIFINLKLPWIPFQFDLLLKTTIQHWHYLPCPWHDMSNWGNQEISLKLLI